MNYEDTTPLDDRFSEEMKDIAALWRNACNESHGRCVTKEGREVRQSASVCEVASTASPATSIESRTRAQQMTDCGEKDRSKQSGLFANRRRRIEITIMQRYFLLPGLEPDFRTLRQQRPEGSHAWGEVRSGVGSDKILNR